MKACRVCSDEFPATHQYFHKHKAGRGGLRTICIPCKKIENKRDRQIETIRASRRKARQKFDRLHPEQRRAGRAVSRAILFGRLIPAHESSCAYCEAPAEHYHHWSYHEMYKLDVVPVCVVCHSAIHAGELEDRPKQLPMF